MASESSYEIRVSATGGHAAMPHTGTDPLAVATQIIPELQTIVSRSLNAIEETAVISVTELETDGTINVIPSEVVIKGDCRCFTDATLARIRQRMEQITEGLCLAAGVQGQATVINTFYPIINTEVATEHAVAAAREALGVAQVNPDCAPLMISEDFAAMLSIKSAAEIDKVRFVCEMTAAGFDALREQLQPGMTFAPGKMMVHEENIVITDQGCKLLHRRAPAELPVIFLKAGQE